ncbi:MAG TPA: glycosyltransferase [Candidatus Saccharimonadales bacterium]|nr:glycosyltransferase [Candidatus Saccharimonadales bacterium]
MFNSWLLYLVAFANVMSMTSLGLYIIGANVYDIKKFRTRKLGAQGKRDNLPLVSVVVPAHNESVVIRRTLDSIRASSYPNIEIIVVDDGSTDDTAAIVREYIMNQPKTVVSSYLSRSTGRSGQLVRRFLRCERDVTPIKLVWQANHGKAVAMNNAIENHVHGSLLMCVDADSILHPKAIQQAVHYFKDPQIIGVAANVRVLDNGTLLGRLQRFEHLVGYRSKKFYTLTNTEFIVGGVASTYRTDVVREVGGYDTDTVTEDIGLSMKLIATYGNRQCRIVYAADVVAMTEGVQTYQQLMRQRYRWKMGSLQNLIKYGNLVANDNATKYSFLLSFYRLPMAFLSELMLILQPLLLGYLIYLSVHYRNPYILFGAYFTITMYVLLTLWPDEYLTVREKLKLSLQTLEIYILFYAMDVVQVSAIFRCLFNREQILKRNASSTWVSPTRAGQATPTPVRV